MKNQKLVSVYTKAFLSYFDKKDYDKLKPIFSILYKTTTSEKVRLILSSKDSKKIEFLLSLLGDIEEFNKEIFDFVKFLANANRVNILEYILKEAINTINQENRVFHMKYYSKFDISDEELLELNAIFSKNLNAKLTNTKHKNELNGLKAISSEANIAINLSMNEFKNRLKKQILQNL